MSWSNSSRPSATRASRAMRDRVLRDQPICAVESCGAPAVEDDHIVAWSQRDKHGMSIEDWHARPNHQGLCGYHHAMKTATERAAGRAALDRHPVEKHPGLL